MVTYPVRQHMLSPGNTLRANIIGAAHTDVTARARFQMAATCSFARAGLLVNMIILMSLAIAKCIAMNAAIVLSTLHR